MNIFVSSFNPVEAAQWLDDSRVIKMTLESTQLLSTVFGGPYKPTHANHPCTRWIGENPTNARWLLDHLQALSNEYTRRFNRLHACAAHIPHFQSILADTPSTTPSFWVLCPPSIRTLNPIRGYRDLLNNKWQNAKRSPRWTNAAPPPWYIHTHAP